MSRYVLPKTTRVYRGFSDEGILTEMPLKEKKKILEETMFRIQLYKILERITSSHEENIKETEVQHAKDLLGSFPTRELDSTFEFLVQHLAEIYGSETIDSCTNSVLKRVKDLEALDGFHKMIINW